MNKEQTIRTQNELQFRDTAFRVLKQAGFTEYEPEKKPLLPPMEQPLMKKGEQIYCVETFFSRREMYTSRAILSAGEKLIPQANDADYLPLIVVGGVLTMDLRSELVEISNRTIILDVGNLLYMAQGNRDLYNEMVAQLPYSVSDILPREPHYLPLPNWNEAYSGGGDWRNETIAPPPDFAVNAGQVGAEQFVEEWDSPVTQDVAVGNPMDSLLRLTNEETGETREYRGPVVKVGRDSSNDYQLEGNNLASRHHATFFYEYQMWVLVDNNSTNGTYLNGQQLVPGEKYQITSNDRISFAKQQTLIFDKQAEQEHDEVDPDEVIDDIEQYLSWKDQAEQAEDNHTVPPILPVEDTSGSMGESLAPVFDLDNEWDGPEHIDPWPLKPPSYPWNNPWKNADGPFIVNRPGNGKSSYLTRIIFEKLQKDIRNWKGGKETNSTDYENLCTQTLMRLFADDLTLWKEQARSNDDLFRFDLICKIKRDNYKDFWEMAERYFNSKYIIFEFKNYAGKVTQKEVYTTVRYLYTKAMRGVAFIISPNGMDENAGKAIRGVLRDEGKLILSLTNEELIHMLQMKEDGEDPADFLSDKLDELLIDLEK